jgi:oligopeptide/dipeptide ABC transporter ATP-binding protein
VSTTEQPLLQVDRLEKTFGGRRGTPAVYALNGVSFDVAAGETFGLVGESGCGKSTLARCVLRLVEPTGGRVLFEGADLGALDAGAMRALRQKMQIVFQDPYSSLDPRMSARAIVEEPLIVHGLGDRTNRRDRALELLELVGLTAAQGERKPYAFSGGQRQRIGIARALVLDPRLVILDEPISALDVSIQAQMLNLLADLRESLGLTYVFIGHDLAVAEYFCDRLAVLYLGEVMELADKETLFKAPLHPYTVSLIAAVPSPKLDKARARTRTRLVDEVAPLGERAQGCPFRPRCPVGRDRAVCADEKPPLTQQRPGQWAACHFPGELAAA